VDSYFLLRAGLHPLRQEKEVAAPERLAPDQLVEAYEAALREKYEMPYDPTLLMKARDLAVSWAKKIAWGERGMAEPDLPQMTPMERRFALADWLWREAKQREHYTMVEWEALQPDIMTADKVYAAEFTQRSQGGNPPTKEVLKALQDAIFIPLVQKMDQEVMKTLYRKGDVEESVGGGVLGLLEKIELAPAALRGSERKAQIVYGKIKWGSDDYTGMQASYKMNTAYMSVAKGSDKEKVFSKLVPRLEKYLKAEVEGSNEWNKRTKHGKKGYPGERSLLNNWLYNPDFWDMTAKLRNPKKEGTYEYYEWRVAAMKRVLGIVLEEGDVAEGLDEALDPFSAGLLGAAGGILFANIFSRILKIPVVNRALMRLTRWYDEKSFQLAKGGLQKSYDKGFREIKGDKSLSPKDRKDALDALKKEKVAQYQALQRKYDLETKKERKRLEKTQKNEGLVVGEGLGDPGELLTLLNERLNPSREDDFYNHVEWFRSVGTKIRTGAALEIQRALSVAKGDRDVAIRRGTPEEVASDRYKDEVVSILHRGRAKLEIELAIVSGSTRGQKAHRTLLRNMQIRLKDERGRSVGLPYLESEWQEVMSQTVDKMEIGDEKPREFWITVMRSWKKRIGLSESLDAADSLWETKYPDAYWTAYDRLQVEFRRNEKVLQGKLKMVGIKGEPASTEASDESWKQYIKDAKKLIKSTYAKHVRNVKKYNLKKVPYFNFSGGYSAVGSEWTIQKGEKITFDSYFVEGISTDTDDDIFQEIRERFTAYEQDALPHILLWMKKKLAGEKPPFPEYNALIQRFALEEWLYQQMPKYYPRPEWKETRQWLRVNDKKFGDFYNATIHKMGLEATENKREELQDAFYRPLLNYLYQEAWTVMRTRGDDVRAQAGIFD